MDKRVVRTNLAIRNAYFSLIMEKKTTKVSISEIARRANIDRKTFYLHYSSLDQVLDDYIDEKVSYMQELLKGTDYKADPFNVKTFYKVVNSLEKEDRDLLEQISSSEAYNSLWNRIHEMITEKVVEVYLPQTGPDITKERLTTYADYYVSGMLSLYRKWLRGQYDFTLYELIEIVSEIAENGLQRVIIKTNQTNDQ